MITVTIGLVGRDGAGKTTPMTALPGQAEPSAGTVTHTSPVGHLARRIPGPPTRRSASPTGSCPPAAWTGPRTGCGSQWPTRPAAPERARSACTRAEAAFRSGGGHAAEAEAARAAAGLALAGRVPDEPVAALSGGHRRRVEPARVLFAGPRGALLLDERVRRGSPPPGAS
ncbi:ATP-binding cassette domain-containing protein [Streptomyces sp. MUM 2J]|uniref:ATP-binding cassette domain-containing protein n=1 Tax=Streptomyces sp. MUM 2J TaxID=2791987 RepID=UPI0035ABCCE4|nr:ATP-binding cassette domain-containing protein [Streptomyces sp. MUM 2J]MCH0572072.1 ATP-binding cassette domain-containing protein [Streptomyces sp. MUM 136J]